MDLHLFDVVRLTDGREATLLELHPTHLLVELTTPAPDGFPAALDISPAQIRQVLWTSPEHRK